MPLTVQTPEWPNLHAAEVRKLSTLLEISQALLAAEFRTALTKVLEIIGAHHGAIRSTVVLLNPQTREVAIEASAGAIEAPKSVRYRIGEGITGEVVQHRQPDGRAAGQPRAAVPDPRRIASRTRGPGTDLHLRPDRARRPDGRRPRHRPAVQARSRLRTHREVPRRRRLDDCAGGEGAPAHRGRSRQLLVDENTHLRLGAAGALRLLEPRRHERRDAGGLRADRPGRADQARPCCCAASRAPARSSSPTPSTTTRRGPRSRSSR